MNAYHISCASTPISWEKVSASLSSFKWGCCWVILEENHNSPALRVRVRGAGHQTIWKTESAIRWTLGCACWTSERCGAGFRWATTSTTEQKRLTWRHTSVHENVPLLTNSPLSNCAPISAMMSFRFASTYITTHLKQTITLIMCILLLEVLPSSKWSGTIVPWCHQYWRDTRASGEYRGWRKKW